MEMKLLEDLKEKGQ